MNTIEIVYEYVNISASERLEKHIEEKIATLKERYDFIVRADVFLKKDNKDFGSKHHCGIRLSAPGPRLYASSDEADFVEAINESVRDLKTQLERRESKMASY